MFAPTYEFVLWHDLVGDGALEVPLLEVSPYNLSHKP